MFVLIIRCTHKTKTMQSVCSLSLLGVLARQGPCTLHVHCHYWVYSQGKDHALYMFIVIIGCTHKAGTMHSTCSLSLSGVLARQGPCTLHVHCHHQVFSQGKDHALYMFIVIIRCFHKARTMHSTCGSTSSQQPIPVRWHAPWPGSRSMWMRCATPPCVMKMMRCWLAWALGPTFTARSVTGGCVCVGVGGDRAVDWLAIPTMRDEDDEVLAGMGLSPTSVARSLTVNGSGGGGGGGGGGFGLNFCGQVTDRI